MVVNTNDPDYEHIYSVESYNDNADELLYITPPGSNSDGAAFLLVSRAILHFLGYLSKLCIPAVLFLLIVCFFCLRFDRWDRSRTRQNRRF